MKSLEMPVRHKMLKTTGQILVTQTATIDVDFIIIIVMAI